jgi:hypothetical protein
MGWSGGTYTKWNAPTGWAGDAASGIGIEAGRHDTQDDDFANGINNCLNKAGQNTPTANLPMGGFKHTNCAAAVSSTDYATLGDVQGGISTQGTALSISNTRFSADSSAPNFLLRKSRGASVGTNTIVQNGDVLGQFVFSGANGTGYDIGALIAGIVDGVPGASSDMPGGLVFSTTPDGSASPVERMRISSSGNLGIGLSATSTDRVYIKGSDSTASNNSLQVQNAATTSLFNIRNDGQISTGGAANSPYNNTTASAANMFVSSGGSLQRSTSSLKYKIDVQPYTRGLNELLQLAPVFYKGKNDGQAQFAGLIAEAVDSLGLTEFVQYAEDGSPDALAYGNMVALVVNAIKELATRVEALEAA